MTPTSSSAARSTRSSPPRSTASRRSSTRPRCSAAATLYRAGALFDRVTFYRNDKSPTYDSDPHGFLADPTLAGRESGQQQLAEFLASGNLINTNPSFLEVPIVLPRNLECLHYPDPQTGKEQAREAFPESGDC